MKVTLSKYKDWIGEIYGAYISLGLIAFFLLCYWLGWVHIRELRLLNFPIMLVGIYFALDQHKRIYGHLNYFKAMTLGVYTGGISAITFALFLFILLSTDHSLYLKIVKQEPLGQYMNLYIATSAVALEGIFAGMMATYLAVNMLETERE